MANIGKAMKEDMAILNGHGSYGHFSCNHLLDLDDLGGDGYPTVKSLENISNYTGDFYHLIDSISFMFSEYGRCELSRCGNRWEVDTGGWSGCESVISALERNRLFWAKCWFLSKRGGYYEFMTKI